MKTADIASIKHVDRTRMAFFHAGFFVLVGGAVAFLLGAPYLFIAVTASCMIVYFTYSNPAILLLLVTVLISSILYENVPPMVPLSMGVGSLYISDVIVIFMMCMILTRMLSGRARFVRTPLDIPLLAFYSVALLSAYVAITRFNVNPKEVMRHLRGVTYYLLFFAVTNLLVERKQIMLLLRGLIFIACAVSCIMIVQAVVGKSIQLTPGRVETLETLDATYSGVTRILPPAQTLIFVIFITLACILILKKDTLFSPARIAQIGLTAVALVLTFNRNYWISAMLALGVFALLARGRHRLRMVTAALIAFLLLGVASITLISSGGRMSRFAEAAVERITSVTQGSRVMKSNSIQFREMENEYAFASISQHPLLGTGLASKYRPPFEGEEVDSHMLGYIHNGYLWVTFTMGLLGLLLLMWFLAANIIRGLLNWKKISDPFLQAVVIGFTLSGIGIMAASFVNPIFMQSFSIPVIALMAGAIEAILRMNKREAVEQR